MASREGRGDNEVDPLAFVSTSAQYENIAPKRESTSILTDCIGVKDDLSKMGRFGWCEVAGVVIPTILRPCDEMFLSVRMLERGLLSKFLQTLPTEVLTCPILYSFKVTEVEMNLLNEINSKHCDHQFGREKFNAKDLLVKKKDLVECHEFLDLCHRKMIQKKATEKDRCGFIRIGGTSDVPYTKVGSVKFLPSFYFEGELDHAKCVRLTRWDWAYLRFCCKVQGVKDELIKGDYCEAVALHELRMFFAPGTSFVEYWPSKDFISRVISKTSPRQGCWTRVLINHEGGKFTGQLTPIIEFPLQQLNNQPPYKPIHCLIDEKIVKGINIRPYQYKEVMITLPHLVEQLLPGFTEVQVGDMLVSQDVKLYRANTGHRDIIKQEGWEDKYACEQVPLVIVKDILHNLKTWKNLMKDGNYGTKRSKGI